MFLENSCSFISDEDSVSVLVPILKGQTFILNLIEFVLFHIASPPPIKEEDDLVVPGVVGPHLVQVVVFGEKGGEKVGWREYYHVVTGCVASSI